MKGGLEPVPGAADSFVCLGVRSKLPRSACGDSIPYNWSQSWAGQAATFAQNNWLDVGVTGLTSSQIAAGIQLVDYHSLLAAANGENYIPALTVDGVHPSAAGYAVMTPYTLQALKAATAAPPPITTTSVDNRTL